MTSWRFFGNLPLAKADDTNVVATAECMEDRVSFQPLALVSEVQALSGWLQNVDTLFSTARPQPSRQLLKTQLRAAAGISPVAAFAPIS
jgi:hypothetical protein